MYERPGRSNQDRTCIYTHAWWQKQPSNHFQVDFGAAVIDGHSKYLPQDPTQNEYLRQQGALAADWISKNFGRIFLETSWETGIKDPYALGKLVYEKIHQYVSKNFPPDVGAVGTTVLRLSDPEQGVGYLGMYLGDPTFFRKKQGENWNWPTGVQPQVYEPQVARMLGISVSQAWGDSRIRGGDYHTAPDVFFMPGTGRELLLGSDVVAQTFQNPAEIDKYLLNSPGGGSIDVNAAVARVGAEVLSRETRRYQKEQDLQNRGHLSYSPTPPDDISIVWVK